MNKRLLITLILGFFSGLPISLTSSTLQAWYAVHDISIAQIGLLSLVGIPYTIKFMWAPFLDRYSVWHLLGFGRRRSWMLLTQSILALLMIAISFFSPEFTPLLIAILAFAVAISSATQDVTIDAFRTELLKQDERGLGAAYFTFSYRMAMLVSGGLSLIIAQHFGWQIMFLIMAVIMILAVLFSLSIKSTDEESIVHHKHLADILIKPFQSFFKQPLAAYVILFILFYKVGEAFTLALTTTFFIRDLHYSLQEVGVLYKTFGPLSLVVGSFLGGVILKHVKLYSGLMWFGVLQIIGILFFALLAYTGPSYVLSALAVIMENFTSGLGTIALFAFIMSICDLRYTASQFALFTAMFAITRVVVGPAAGLFVQQMGWLEYYLLGALLSIPGLYWLFCLREHKALA